MRRNVKVPIVHLWSKFGYNWSEPVRTGAIWKRLTETLTDGRTYRIWIAMCLHEHSFRRHKNILQKTSPHLLMAHRNNFRWNNLWILKLATYTKIEDHYFSSNWQLFRLEGIAKCSYFILSTQNIKFYWFVMKIKKFCCQFDDTIEVDFLLGINIWGLPFWMG